MSAKVMDSASAIPLVARYMYLAREQERRDRTDDEHLEAQCPVPESRPPIPPLRSADNDNAPSSTRRFTRLGGFLTWTLSATQQWWNACAYGAPVGLGEATGMIWNRRDVLRAPLSARPVVRRGGVEFGQPLPHTRISTTITWGREKVTIGHFWLGDLAVCMVECNQSDLVFGSVNNGVMGNQKMGARRSKEDGDVDGGSTDERTTRFGRTSRNVRYRSANADTR